MCLCEFVHTHLLGPVPLFGPFLDPFLDSGFESVFVCLRSPKLHSAPFEQQFSVCRLRTSSSVAIFVG